MKFLSNIANKIYNNLFNIRCDTRPGIRYFDEHHFKNLKKDPFEFKNDNGFMLRGGIYHNDKYSKDTIVIFCHGMGGGHQAYMKEIDYIAHHGYQVLAVDYQGTILSEGDKLGGPTQALLDMSKMIDIIKNDYKNIYVIGHSWGGFVAQGLTALHPEIKKVVTLAGMNSLSKLIEQYFPWYIKFLRKPILNIEYNNYGELALSSASKNLNRKDLSALVIQSMDDKILKPKFNFFDVKANVNNKNVDFCAVVGKNHNPTYTVSAVQKLTAYLHELNKTDYIDEQHLLEQSVNWDELCELDKDIMEKIIDFFNK